MNKKEVALIKAKESALWTELQEARRDYVKAHFPAGYGYINAESTEYVKDDINLWALINEWSAVARLMDDLGIESDFNEEAHDAHTDAWEYLEGRGEYAPAEEEEEEEEEEEVTEEPEDVTEEMEEPDETVTVYATDDTHEFFKVATYNRHELTGFFFTEDYRESVVKAGFDERVVLLAVGNISGDYIGINHPRD